MIGFLACAGGAIAGAISARVHLGLLQRHLIYAQGSTPCHARHLILRRFPWRLAVWLPGLLVAVHLGLGGCLGFVIGTLAVRWAVLWRFWGRHQPSEAPLRERLWP